MVRQTEGCATSHSALILLAIALLFLSPHAYAQDPCPHGSPQHTADALADVLTNARTCVEAADLFDKCRWGSSADTEFAPIVISKCEKTFYNRLSLAGQKRYGEEIQLCAYEYARQQGTLSMSEAASCQVDVATRFSANPTLANQPLPQAGFDCAKAQSPLEKEICSNVPLGHADIVLSRAYSRMLKGFRPAEQSALKENQQKWLQNVPAKCSVSGPPYSQKSLNCVRNEFEIRFSDLDSCQDGDGGVNPCLWKPNASDDAAGEPETIPSAPRASFDCEAPNTALEIVICADAELGQSDIKLAQAYRDADKAIGSAKHKDLVETERKWLRFVNTSCPLGAVGGIPPLITRACVRSAFQYRIEQLKTCPQMAPAQRDACLNNFQITQN